MATRSTVSRSDSSARAASSDSGAMANSLRVLPLPPDRSAAGGGAAVLVTKATDSTRRRKLPSSPRVSGRSLSGIWKIFSRYSLGTAPRLSLSVAVSAAMPSSLR